MYMILEIERRTWYSMCRTHCGRGYWPC